MFRKLAKFRPLETWRVAPGTRILHSNDNLRGFRHPPGRQRPRPNLALACHWYLIGDQLECRWELEAPDGAPVDDFQSQPKAGRAFGSPLALLTAGNMTLRATG